MEQIFKVFVVDDDPLTIEMARILLEPEIAVLGFASAESCLLALGSEKPDMFLLDITLPEMDGYELCRRIKADDALNSIPVTFVSAFDDIESRLSAYEAGGQDFIVKPFDPKELVQKIKIARQIIEYQEANKAQAEEARNLALMVMSNMDELGYVLSFMRELITCESEGEIACRLLELAQQYGLSAVVQARVFQRQHTISAAGTDVPLETSVMLHVRELERVYEFRQRASFNFDRVTLMINNMPTHDPDLCGRLRDNLCFAVEGADSRLLSVEIQETNVRNKAGILQTIASIREVTDALFSQFKQDRAQCSELMFRLDQSLANSFLHLGLTAKQEAALSNLINESTERLMTLFDNSAGVPDSFQQIRDQLENLT